MRTSITASGPGLVRWRHPEVATSEGECVARGQILGVIVDEGDGRDTAISCPDSGILETVAADGQRVVAGSLLARLF